MPRSTRSYTCPVDPRRSVRARVPRMPDSAPSAPSSRSSPTRPRGPRCCAAGGRAFVSPSLRPTSSRRSLDEGDRRRPALVVAGDDRQARDLAADLRAWLAPRPVRFYPSRGVAYESHLAPPPHLVGLRVAALDALLAADGDGEPPVVVVVRRRAEREGPRPRAAPALVRRCASATCIDLDEVAGDLVAAGYERVDQVEDRGQFAIRGGILDVYPATEDRAVRVDLFDIEIESLRWFSTFTQRSLGDTDAVEIAPSAELAAEHRELAEIAALRGRGPPRHRRAAARRPLPRVPRPAPPTPRSSSPPRRRSSPRCADHWQDVCAAFHDDDAHHLYVQPDAIRAALDERARIRAVVAVLRPAASSSAPRPPTSTARSLKEAEPELEKLLRSGYRTVVAWPRRGEGERAAYNLARLQAGWIDGDAETPEDAALRPGAPARRLHRRRPEARGHPRAPAVPPPPRRAHATTPPAPRRAALVRRPAHRRHRRPRGPRRRALRGLRDEDRRRRHARLPGARVRRARTRSSCPSTSWRRSAATSARAAAHPPLSKLGGKRWETLKARARRAAQELAGELLNLYAERKRRSGHAFEPDGDWQREFEDAFPYSETPDQRDAIERRQGATWRRPGRWTASICGDVGYGKTEVALRAAFKAAADGKQVLVLVADDDPRPAALRHVRRAPQGLPVHGRAGQPLPPAPRSRRRRSPGSRRARSTSSSARTACWAATSARRTSGCSSSTRSSASASSRRSCCASSS